MVCHILTADDNSSQVVGERNEPRHIRLDRGVKVGKKAMEKYNEFVERMPSLEKWFLTISPGYFG
ncbi:MAG: hypothetical protein D3915_15490 [Candidatus Electrothrix sp. AU1_5]|nr:hypothetical protein [Candidatus Electrothrix gigas]